MAIKSTIINLKRTFYHFYDEGFTAAAALETLGKDYQYKTKIAFDGNLYITSNGDPTLEMTDLVTKKILNKKQ